LAAEGSYSARGRYRILLGAAPGVGKTYRMLLEGRLAANGGVDVVIGYLEPHDRPETAALAEGLEVVSRRRIEHGGLGFEEMDVDAVIRRAPELVLVDELAHTNAPGCRNAKRYEDIEAILSAAIDVVSTTNVQHLESLNDAVFELTGVRVRETFPDRVLDEADEVVLVDLPPEELQQRIQQGKVYPRERIDAALASFFRTDNLNVLRELSLREVAEEIEHQRHSAVLDPRGQQDVAERILALVKPHPKAQRLLRRAWRSAQRLDAEVDALWIHRPGQKLSEEERVSLATLQRLSVRLRAHFLDEESNDLVETVRRIAIARGSTYVFVGTPVEGRLQEIARGSLVMRLVRALPGVNVQVVADRAKLPTRDADR
jgi:two-component system sensor histidine kinase KdpD